MALSVQAGLLRVEDLIIGYGKKQVVNGVSLDVARGEIVALIGQDRRGGVVVEISPKFEVEERSG